MNDTIPEAPTEATAPEATASDPYPAAPEDAAEERATGYAIYDRTIGQYLPGVFSLEDKPTKRKATDAVPKGHVAAVVRV